MKRKLSFVAVLVIFWLGLSGHFSGMLLSLGAASVLLVAWLSQRMAVLDRDGHPFELFPRTPGFLLWLAREIYLASIAVLKLVISNRYEPDIGRVKSKQSTALGTATLANSITLTPGTLSMRIVENEIEVHTIHAPFLADLQNSNMPDIIRRYDGQPPQETQDDA